MKSSLAQLAEAQRLAETGRHQALLDFLTPQREAIARSPTLALLYGIAQARLGRDAEGREWVMTALKCATERGDGAIEGRALNVLGAIALEEGRVEEAADHFMRALAEARRQDDHATVGRCSNNLGIIAHLRGEHGKAVSWYRLALAAYQLAGLARGIAETHHNLAMTHLETRDLKQALEEADRAVQEAEKTGDPGLVALTLAGRAEVRAMTGDAAFAHREVYRALVLHRQVGDLVGEAQDLRILAVIVAGGADAAEAERILREVIARSESLGRPHLGATARRDLAQLLKRTGRLEEAREIAQAAKTLFDQVGAVGESCKLGELAASE